VATTGKQKKKKKKKKKKRCFRVQPELNAHANEPIIIRHRIIKFPALLLHPIQRIGESPQPRSRLRKSARSIHAPFSSYSGGSEFPAQPIVLLPFVSGHQLAGGERRRAGVEHRAVISFVVNFPLAVLEFHRKSVARALRVRVYGNRLHELRWRERRHELVDAIAEKRELERLVVVNGSELEDNSEDVVGEAFEGGERFLRDWIALGFLGFAGLHPAERRKRWGEGECSVWR
jgi:hypothetical protein